MIALKHMLELLINPYFIALLLLAVSLVLLRHHSGSKTVFRIVLLVFLMLLSISTGWLPGYLTRHLEYQYSWVKNVNPEVSWIVVLSGGQAAVRDLPPNDVLSSASMKRLIEGVRLFRKLPDAHMVLSGGGSIGEQPEALLLEQLALWFSLPKEKLVLETLSMNTEDQARELAFIVKQQPFYLVTSAIHMPRSMALCKQMGLHPIAAPTDFTYFWSQESGVKKWIPNSYNVLYFSIALHELLGRGWWGFKGAINKVKG